MSLLSKYTTSDMFTLLNQIYKTDWVNPIYNGKSKFVSVDNKTGKLEVELAGYASDEIKVYTEENKLVVSAKKSDNSRKYYYHWLIEENEQVGEVTYENGLLTIQIKLVEPESPKRKFYQIK